MEGLSLAPRLAAGVSVHDIDDEALAFDGHVLSRLTGTSALVARLVDGSRSIRAIAGVLGSPAAEVLAAVDELITLGLVELVDAGRGFRRQAHVGVVHDGDQVILLDLRDGERRLLNPTAAAIWDALMAAGSLEEAVALLQEDFPEAPGLTEDTERFVAGLEAQGLVERGEGF